MKIRNGFISNSSSCSSIAVNYNKINKTDLIKRLKDEYQLDFSIDEVFTIKEFKDVDKKVSTYQPAIDAYNNLFYDGKYFDGPPSRDELFSYEDNDFYFAGYENDLRIYALPQVDFIFANFIFGG